jgi:hypothetical protein
LEVASTVLGAHQGNEYKVDYAVIAKPNWEMVSCRLKNWLGTSVDIQNIQHDGKGNWTNNGTQIDDCKACIDIDISVTPFTNSLPINRLRLQVSEVRQIKVLYFDVLQRTIRSAVQQYAKLSDYEYRYENVPNDFSAVITVDQWGIVKKYAGLFIRLNGDI